MPAHVLHAGHDADGLRALFQHGALLDVHFKQLLLGRPLAGPPGIPPDRLAALRAAFDASMKDPDFRAEADKLGLDIDPASAADVDALLRRYAAYPLGVFRQAQEAIGR